jgi:hypothetical protein
MALIWHQTETAFLTYWKNKDKLAEEEGFEPPVSCPTTVFKTAALNRSATPPDVPSSRAANS